MGISNRMAMLLGGLINTVSNWWGTYQLFIVQWCPDDHSKWQARFPGSQGLKQTGLWWVNIWRRWLVCISESKNVIMLAVTVLVKRTLLSYHPEWNSLNVKNRETCPQHSNSTWHLTHHETEVKSIQDLGLLLSFWDSKRLLEICYSLGYSQSQSVKKHVHWCYPAWWKLIWAAPDTAWLLGCFLEYSSYLVGIRLPCREYYGIWTDIIFNSSQVLFTSTLTKLDQHNLLPTQTPCHHKQHCYRET